MYRDDITGLRFGRLVVMAQAQPARNRMRRFVCKCDCGHETIVRLDNLRSGSTWSCGCGKADIAAKALFIHGEGIRGKESAEFKTWLRIMARCHGPNSPNRYGGRGICVCARWRGSFAAFLEDMGRKPSPEYSIERINRDGNYEPGNCRWATPKEQCRNRSITRMVETKTGAAPLAQLAEEAGLAVETLRRRLSRGWSIERAISKIGSR